MYHSHHHHRHYYPRPQRMSVTTLILASSYISGNRVFGPLDDGALRFMSLPDSVSEVRANGSVMLHLATRKDRLRRDTTIYQWIGRQVEQVVLRPSHIRCGTKKFTFELAGLVDPHRSCPGISHLVAVLKYVSRSRASSGAAELWLSTIIPKSNNRMREFVRNATTIEA